MSENAFKEYTFSEQKEIVKLSRDADKTKLMATMIKELKMAVKQTPDLEWTQFSELHPELDDLKGYGQDPLKNSFEIYKSSRKAVSYWEKKLIDDPGSTKIIKERFNIPEQVNIEPQDISFVNDSCIIRLDKVGIDTIFRASIMKSTDAPFDPDINPTAYALHYFENLQDDKGNHCSVMIVPKNVQQVIIDHEEQHGDYDRYYRRRNVEHGAQSESIPQAIEKVLQQELVDLSIEEKQQCLPGLMNQQLCGYRTTLFYNEALAYAAEGNREYEDTQSSLRLEESGSLEIFHPYSRYMGATIEGYVRYANTLNLTNSEKTRLIFDLHCEFAAFEDQNETIQEWLNMIKETIPDKESLVASLEAIPPTRLWTIGYFIDREPEQLKEQLYTSTISKSEEQHERAFWRSFIRENNITQDEIDRDDTAIAKIVDDTLGKLDITTYDDLDYFEYVLLPNIYNTLQKSNEISLFTKIDSYYQELKKSGAEAPQSVASIKLKSLHSNIRSLIYESIREQGQQLNASYAVWGQYLVATNTYSSARIDGWIPHSEESVKDYSWKIARDGDVEGALEVLEANLDIYKEDTWYQHDRARFQVQAGGRDRVSEAVKTLEDLVSKNSENAQIHASLAFAYARLGKFDQSRAYYRKAYELDPNNFDARLISTEGTTIEDKTRMLHEQGVSFLERGEYHEALRYYDGALALGSEYLAPWSMHDRSVAFLKTNNIEEGMRCMERAEELLPSIDNINVEMAEAYLTMERESENKHYPFKQSAVWQYRKALKKNPDNKDAKQALDRLGLAYEIPRVQTQLSLSKDGKEIWLDENSTPINRDVQRERQREQHYLSEIRRLDPAYYRWLEKLSQEDTMLPMSNANRLSINIPAWAEGKNIYRVLSDFASQVDPTDIPLDTQTYEINVILNRKSGTPEDNSLAEIQRFNKETNGKYQVNCINVEFDPPFNRIGHARKVLTDLTLMRSLLRSQQDQPLYIETEDADLEAVDPHTVYNAVATLDQNPHLDAVKGLQDFAPWVLEKNDFLFLQRRIWNFATTLMERKRYSSRNNTRSSNRWNRRGTGGWNTAYTAEAYALIEGYSNMITGSDMNIGERITQMRGDGKADNFAAVGKVRTRSHSSARRFIEALYAEQSPYADGFFDQDNNLYIRNASIDELLRKIDYVSRISPDNMDAFGFLLNQFNDFFRSFTPNEQEFRQFQADLLTLIGFKTGDFHFGEGGRTIVDNWANVQSSLSEYRAKHKGEKIRQRTVASPVD